MPEVKTEPGSKSVTLNFWNIAGEYDTISPVGLIVKPLKLPWVCPIFNPSVESYMKSESPPSVLSVLTNETVPGASDVPGALNSSLLTLRKSTSPESALKYLKYAESACKSLL